jgi:hypothetical protein
MAKRRKTSPKFPYDPDFWVKLLGALSGLIVALTPLVFKFWS